MKRVAVFVVALNLCFNNGCSVLGLRNKPTVLMCTQETVCTGVIDPQKYNFFDSAVDTGIVMPGLCQNFIPQGIAFWEQQNRIFVSGYFMPLSGIWTTALLAIDNRTGELVGEYTLVDDKGRELGGHFSGVAVSDKDLYVTGECCLYRVPLMVFSSARSSGPVQVDQIIPVSIGAGSCNYSDGILWVCEHYRTGVQSDKAHIPNGDSGWMIGYKTTENGTLRPYCVFSVPDRIQGITVLSDGYVVLSQSYGRKNTSKVFVYADPRQDTPDMFVPVGDTTVPLWQLESGDVVREFTAPPMAEGCCAVGDKVYVIFESAACYYRALSPENTAVDPTDKIWKLKLGK